MLNLFRLSSLKNMSHFKSLRAEIKFFGDKEKGTGSILHNKDQVGPSDKSYSGTDSKHTYGSDRVNDDKLKKGLTSTPDDSSVHHNIRHPNLNQEKASKEMANDNKLDESLKKRDNNKIVKETDKDKKENL